MRIEAHMLSIPARDGCEAHRIFCRDYGNENAQRTVVCAHGMMRNGDDFDLLARALAATGVRVLVPDMAGRGNSDWLKNPLSYTYATYIEDCKFLLQNFHLRQVDWVGTSMGGIIGMLIASSDTRTMPFIRRLVLNDVGSFIPKQALTHIYSYVDALPKNFPTREEAADYIRRNYTEFGISEERFDAFIDRSIEESAEGGFRLRADPEIIAPIRHDTEHFTKVNDVNLNTAWEEIRLPTLIIRGANSRLLLPETVQAMKASNLRASSIEYKGCGHAPALEDARQISDILDFLQPERTQSLLAAF